MTQPAPISCEIAVIGAGVIGLTTAYELARHGHAPLVIDPNTPGSGASFGNAGTIADYAVIPLGNPAVFKQLPYLLLNPNSPFTLHWRSAPGLVGWLAQFLHNCTPGRARENATVLAGLLGDATQRWQGLCADLGGSDLLQQRGALYMYESDAAFQNATADEAFRRKFGVSLEVLDASQLRQLEPGLPIFEGGAHFFPKANFLTDPGQMMTRLAQGVCENGGAILSQKVSQIHPENGTVTLALGDGGQVRARRVVIAAGAHSAHLAAQIGERINMTVERGYHVEYDMENPPVTRPTCSAKRGFYAIPMQGRLRVAGTVELGGLNAPATSARAAQIDRGARALFPELPPPDRKWMGLRPSMPNTLPVIRPARGNDAVILACGHGHLGLTMAPITAQRVLGYLRANRGPA